jgi:hypothetical protein
MRAATIPPKKASFILEATPVKEAARMRKPQVNQKVRP